MSVLGIDIGNDTCYVAVSKSGGIEVIDNEYSLRATPSFVGFHKRSRDIGVTAKAKLIQNIENTIFGFKTILGKKFNDCEREQSYLPFNFREFPSGDIGIQVKYLEEEVVFSVQQITAMMLTKLKTITEANLRINVRDCVISVPIYYTDFQRKAVLYAAEIAGLKPLRLMNEPTAIALAYGFYKQNLFEEPKTIVFVDMGHSALTVTACTFEKDRMKVLGSVWNTNVGGRDFDCVLAQHFADQIKSRYQLDVKSSRKALMALLFECENLKKQMSMNSRELDLYIECFMNEVDVRGKMNRSLFEKLSVDLLQAAEKTMRDLLEWTELETLDIYSVQMVGGSCRIPTLKDIITSVFDQEPHSTLNQDEAVARGCALQCAFLSPTLRTREFYIEDIQPFALNICRKMEFEEEVLEPFPRFHKIPSSKLLTLSHKGPFTLEAFYADPKIRHPQVGRYNFDKPLEVMSGSKVEIKVSLDSNGIFAIGAARIVVKEEQVADPEVAIDAKKDVVVPDETIKQVGDLETKLKIVIKYHNLEFEPPVSSMPRHVLKDLMEQERRMINAELHEKKMADLRNVLEEYVYSMKGRLVEDFVHITSDDVSSRMSNLLNETEEWLYDNENPQELELTRKLKELKEAFEPLLQRFYDWQDVFKKLENFSTLIESSWEKISLLFDGNCHENINNLASAWGQKKEFFDECSRRMNGFSGSAEIPVSSAKIQNEMQDLAEKLATAEKSIETHVVEAKETGDFPDDMSTSQDNKQTCNEPSSESHIVL